MDREAVLNVNEGHNQELMEHCQTLKEYAQYVAKVRKYTSLGELSLEEAVECAVEECIKEGILAEFLIQNRAEVISMSIFEYNKDEEEKKLRKAEFEAGREAGIEEGRMVGIKEGRMAGIEEGRSELLKQLIQRKLSKGKSIDEIAEELGLLDRVMQDGWKSLTSKETGRIGGMVTGRRREIKKQTKIADKNDER